MHSSRILRFLVALAGLCYGLAPSSAHAQSCPVGDTCFADGFELPFNFPANDAEAARFLNQATFGATASDITAVRQQSISVWLENQLNSGTTTLSRPWLEAYAASLPAGSSINQDDRMHRWFDVAVTSPDQVRQRVAWALAQIVITSDTDEFLNGKPVQMAEWNDIIVRNALGNYRQLMQDVTYSPMMGRYLTTLRNRKFELQRGGTAQNPTFTAGNNGVQPDENYAREVMQLFSIGLLVRGGDFYQTFPDPQDPNGSVSTYDEEAISNLARVFTGLTYGCTQGPVSVGGVTMSRNCGANNTACTGPGCRFTNPGMFFNDPPGDIVATNRGLEHPDWYGPMVCYPRYNDNGRDTSGATLEDPNSSSFTLPTGSPAPNKTVDLNATSGLVNLTVGPSTFPAGSLNPLNCHNTAPNLSLTAEQQQACVTYCEGNINSAIQALFDHPNTPPMVARQMIQRLVTSNPTSGYVQRVAAAFTDNGSGMRGDMKALVRAILLDVEARRPFNDPATSVNFGKPREPMLKLVGLWRKFGAVSGDTALFPATNPQGLTANPLAGQPYRRRWGPTAPQDLYQQRPYGAPSVFNFYEPDYRQPGQVADAGLFSPELQIIHEVSGVSAANDLYARICAGYGGANGNCSSGALTGGPSNTPPNDRAYFPIAQIDLLPAVAPLSSNPSTEPTLAQDMALINFFNARMMGGTMSGADVTTFNCQNSQPGMKWQLMNALRCGASSPSGPGINEAVNGGTNGTTGGDRDARERRKALYLMHLISVSPEYSFQR
jgi:uncharacterized protein (DUF1800 family)